MYGNNNPYGGYPYQTAGGYYGAGYSNPTYQTSSPQPMSNTNKIYANGIEDVRCRQLPNNSDYIFLDNDKPLVYRKTTDATGKMNIQVFKIVPYEPETVAEKPNIDMSQYVLKEDFESLRKEISELKLEMPKKKQIKKEEETL